MRELNWERGGLRCSQTRESVWQLVRGARHVLRNIYELARVWEADLDERNFPEDHADVLALRAGLGEVADDADVVAADGEDVELADA